MTADVRGLGDQRLLVGVAVRDQGAVGRGDEGEPVLADADVVDDAPHLLEVQLADEPAGGLIEAGQADREDAGRQEVVVDPDRRHRDALEHDRRVGRDRDARRADPARGDDAALLVEQRQFAELVELQDVVPEDRRLLPLLEAGVLQLRRQGLEDFGMAGDIPADLLGGPGGDAPIAGDHGLARAALQRHDRDEAVADERHDRGQRQNQRELAADAADSEPGHGQLRVCRSGYRRQAATSAEWSRMSRPGSTGTSNRVLTALARSLHARKIAGGSATMAS